MATACLLAWGQRYNLRCVAWVEGYLLGCFPLQPVTSVVEG